MKKSQNPAERLAKLIGALQKSLDEAVGETLEHVGSQLKEAREAAGLTQADVASRIGYTRSAIANIEAANQDLPIGTLVRIALVMGKGVKITIVDL